MRYADSLEISELLLFVYIVRQDIKKTVSIIWIT